MKYEHEEEIECWSSNINELIIWKGFVNKPIEVMVFFLTKYIHDAYLNS